MHYRLAATTKCRKNKEDNNQNKDPPQPATAKSITKSATATAVVAVAIATGIAIIAGIAATIIVSVGVVPTSAGRYLFAHKKASFNSQISVLS